MAKRKPKVQAKAGTVKRTATGPRGGKVTGPARPAVAVKRTPPMPPMGPGLGY